MARAPTEVRDVTTAIVGGTLVTESGVADGTILVDEQGRIVGLLDPAASVSAEETIDAAGTFIFPGGVDSHSHLNDPGLTASEDFLTGTSGAAAGGYTTVLEMPQTLPLVDSVVTFEQKLAAVSPKAVVDFGLYCALVPNNAHDPEALKAIAEAGAIAFKSFVCDTPEMPRLSESELARGMEGAHKLGLPVAVHCESQRVIDLETERVLGEGPPDVYTLAGTHPLEAEEESVRATLGVAAKSGGSLHLVHMSDPSTVELANLAKLQGVDVTVETCPHYLALTREDLHRVGGWGLCFPPLRTEAAVEGLWRALEMGLIDNIGSDHCAYTLDQKETTDPWKVLPGINGIQLALPILVHGAMKRGIPLSAVARAFSSGPARRFSLYPRKGDIRIGSEADLVFVDTRNSIVARAAELYTRCPGTAYEEMMFDARVVRTMVRGTTVYVDDGEPSILVEPGWGAFLNGEEARAGRGQRVPTS